MAGILLKNLVLVGGGEAVASVFVEDGKIAAVGGSDVSASGAEVIDLDGGFLLPGFVDIHIHGAVGVDVNAADRDGLMEVAAFLARKGVTSWVPTLVPDSDENYRRVIGEIDALMELQVGKPIAQAVGVHYEGVFANEKMCGALRPRFFKSGQWSVSGGQLPRLKNGIHLTTLAPEIEDGVAVVEKLTNEGWITSIGHTRADVATLDAAFAAGARHMTHFFNAMTGVHHRDVGVAGWGLTNADVTFDIIADGVHVDPQVLAMACRAKSVDKVSLISDSVSPTGLGDGEFEIWGEKVSVKDRKTQNERGSIAGSVISMHDAFVRMLSLGFSMAEASKMASANPSRVLGLSDDIGSIAIGKRADLVCVDGEGKIKLVMVGGVIVEASS